MPSENIKIPEEFKSNRKNRRDVDQYHNTESPAEENQSLRKALTCNLEVSTFEGENQRKMVDRTRGTE